MKTDNTIAIPKKNKWQQLYNFLTQEERNQTKELIKEFTNWSEQSFYRKMKDPDNLRPMEKQVIAKIYNLPVDFIF